MYLIFNEEPSFRPWFREHCRTEKGYLTSNILTLNLKDMIPTLVIQYSYIEPGGLSMLYNPSFHIP